MEDLGLRALYRRVAGIDVHRMLHVVTVLIEQPDGSMQRQTREFGGFRRDCRALAAWLGELGVELVVMESTGIYWKSVHAHLENAGIAAWVVNAHMIKHVPGRKTDMADSEWLAVLARFGLVRASFIPPKDLRELRLVSRYRRKLSAMCASELNRLHKILDDGGIKLGGVVSDINGVSARAMVSALIEGQPIEQMLGLARGRLKQKREDLSASLEGDLSARHLFVLGHIQAHIETLRCELTQIDAYLLAAMQPYAWAHQLLQTIPGIDQIAAALILIEIGDDMARFASPARGCSQWVVASASRRAANAATSVLRGFHLMSQSTCGMPCRLHDSMPRIRRTESKPESRRARIGTFGPAALRRCAMGMTRSRLKSVSLAECCTPGRSASSRQNPCEPR